MRFSIIAAVCSLLTGVVASPTLNSKRHVLHESRGRLPINWRRSAELHRSTLLPLRIALTQTNLDQADEFLMDVSHPESPNFGNHWTAKQVAEAFAPTDETVTSVLNWLAETGISPDRVRQSQGLNWLHAEVTVEEAEHLLKTKYHTYIHTKTGQAHVACAEYSIPEEIRQHVDFITPTVHFDAKIVAPKKRRTMHEQEIETVKRQISTDHKVGPRKENSLGSPESESLPKLGDVIPFAAPSDELKNCDTSIVPDCLRALYLIPDDVPTNPESKSISIFIAPPGSSRVQMTTANE
jgi:tripeptidyl-peptidase-1